MSHTFCRTQKKQKKKILLYRKIYCERQHQLTLFFVRAVQKDCNKAYASTKAFYTEYYPCTHNKHM